MIFDSEEARELCAKYARQQDFKVPNSVFLARSEKLAGEREYLEGLIQSVSDSVRKGWIKRLLSANHAQHLGAWFEMMLYGWLKQLGEVLAEPDILGDNPDVQLSVGAARIIVEAKALPIIDSERERNIQESELCWVLDQIKRPYIVSVEAVAFGKQLECDKLSKEVAKWLDEAPDEPFLFEDDRGNRVFLRAKHSPNLRKVATLATFEMEWINPGSLKDALEAKAKQHPKMRRAGYPYILAIMPESWKLSADEVVTAWFGNEQLTIDIKTNEIIDQRMDQSGIHFFASEIRHKTVSGTLVFKRDYSGQMKMHQMRTWYVENPFAKVPLDPRLFPAEGRYVVMEKGKRSLKMGWETAQNP